MNVRAVLFKWQEHRQTTKKTYNILELAKEAAYSEFFSEDAEKLSEDADKKLIMFPEFMDTLGHAMTNYNNLLKISKQREIDIVMAPINKAVYVAGKTDWSLITRDMNLIGVDTEEVKNPNKTLPACVGLFISKGGSFAFPKASSYHALHILPKENPRGLEAVSIYREFRDLRPENFEKVDLIYLPSEAWGYRLGDGLTEPMVEALTRNQTLVIRCGYAPETGLHFKPPGTRVQRSEYEGYVSLQIHRD